MHELIKKKKKPGANPVSGFPSGAARAAAASATKSEASHSRHVATFTKPTRRIILGSATLEAAGTASKVVSTAVADATVPVTRSNVRPSAESKRRASSPSKTSIVA